MSAAADQRLTEPSLKKQRLLPGLGGCQGLCTALFCRQFEKLGENAAGK